MKETAELTASVKSKYVHKDPFRHIDGFGLSDDIPETQQAKINALKNKHWPLFVTKASRFDRILQYYAPK